MNFTYKTLVKLAGLLLGITGVAMLPSFLCAYYFGEKDMELVFFIISTASILLGFSIYRLVPKSKKILKLRDGYLIVICCWINCSIFGAIPFIISGQIPSFIDAFFEAVAGYTTTGASIILDTQLSPSLVLWKATTHWLGGMGILVFIISISPTLGIDGQRIIAAETPGSGINRMAPRIHDLTKLLYLIYITMTLAEFLILWLGSKMNAFEALVNSLGSISTAGLFLHPHGVAYYDSIFVEMVISFFSILASVNFIIYIHLIKRNPGQVRKNIELRFFLIIIFIATILITLDLRFSETYKDIWQALRHSFFQVTSFMSTSGFTITDYGIWPTFSRLILFTLLFIGGCAVSTSGGIKVVRLIVLFKLIVRGFFKRLHPRAVSSIKIGDNTVSASNVSHITTFLFLYALTFLIGSLVLSLQGLSIETTLTATASLMSTTGTGLGDVGPAGSYAVFSPPLRLFMSLLMLVGRLELYTVFLMMFPSFWNANRFISK